VSFHSRCSSHRSETHDQSQNLQHISPVHIGLLSVKFKLNLNWCQQTSLNLPPQIQPNYTVSKLTISGISISKNIGNWIADPRYLKEQPPIFLGRRDNQTLTSESCPKLVNWSDPPNGGRWYNLDPCAGGRWFNLAEIPPPGIYCLNHYSTIYTHHYTT
jgi:hypothetical protein